MITTLVPLAGVVHDPHAETVIATARRAQAAYTVIRDNDLRSLSSTKTSANRGDEFLEVALIADKDGKSAMLFDLQVVQKRGGIPGTNGDRGDVNLFPYSTLRQTLSQGRLSRCTLRHKSLPLPRICVDVLCVRCP